MDNDLLNIWLKARNGLPADEARDLVARVETLEKERAEDERLRETTYTQAEYEDGIAAAFERGAKDGRFDGWRDALAAAHEAVAAMGDDVIPSASKRRALLVLDRLRAR